MTSTTIARTWRRSAARDRRIARTVAAIDKTLARRTRRDGKRTAVSGRTRAGKTRPVAKTIATRIRPGGRRVAASGKTPGRATERRGILHAKTMQTTGRAQIGQASLLGARVRIVLNRPQEPIPALSRATRRDPLSGPRVHAVEAVSPIARRAPEAEAPAAAAEAVVPEAEAPREVADQEGAAVEEAADVDEPQPLVLILKRDLKESE